MDQVVNLKWCRTDQVVKFDVVSSGSRGLHRGGVAWIKLSTRCGVERIKLSTRGGVEGIKLSTRCGVEWIKLSTRCGDEWL